MDFAYMTERENGEIRLHPIHPSFSAKRGTRFPREAYIAKNGIIYEGTVYPFRSFLARWTKSK